MTLAKDENPSVIDTMSSFKTEKVCYYQFRGPPEAQEGDLVYFKVDQISGADVEASIGQRIDDD